MAEGTARLLREICLVGPAWAARRAQQARRGLSEVEVPARMSRSTAGVKTQVRTLREGQRMEWVWGGEMMVKDWRDIQRMKDGWAMRTRRSCRIRGVSKGAETIRGGLAVEEVEGMVEDGVIGEVSRRLGTSSQTSIIRIAFWMHLHHRSTICPA
jgi:hypothetical protein